MNGPSTFERILRDRVKVKNIPNTSFNGGTFTFTDYFDREHFRESFDKDVEQIDEWVEWAYAPFEVYLSNVDEIDVTRFDEDGKAWYGVQMAIPDDDDRQELLAHLIADAWERRIER